MAELIAIDDDAPAPACAPRAEPMKVRRENRIETEHAVAVIREADGQPTPRQAVAPAAAGAAGAAA